MLAIQSVLYKSKMYRHIYIAKIFSNDQLGSKSDQCYIQNCVVTKRVIKRSSVIASLSEQSQQH